jgi:hypothetical protein
MARVTFGSDWFRGGAFDYYKNEIAYYQALISNTDLGDVREYGRYPELEALALFNSTIYRWNRLCYGSTGDSAHLRIENRLIPAGPSMQDQIANVVLWIGLMAGAEGDMGLKDQQFDVHRQNFHKVARYGHEVILNWVDGKSYTVPELYDTHLFDIAIRGLKKHNIPSEEYEPYLELIRKRLSTKQTGSFWLLNSFNELTEYYTEEKASQMLVEAMYDYQKNDTPIYEWETMKGKGHKGVSLNYTSMTELTVVFDTDSLELIQQKANWSKHNFIVVMNESFYLKGYLDLNKKELSKTSIDFDLFKFAEPVQYQDLTDKKVKEPTPVYDDKKVLGIKFPG